MANRDDECSHPTNMVVVDVTIDTAPPCNDSAIRRMRIFGHCMLCHQRIRFVGVPFAQGLDVPSTTPDAFEARIPYLMVAP